MEINIINASEQELIQAIRTNIKECKATRSQIARLREVGQSASTKFHYEEQVVAEEIEEDEDEDTLKDEVDFYYSSISDTPVEQLEKKIASLLPSKTSYHYQEIIYRIKAEIVKSIKELKDYLHDEKCSKDEVHELKGEIRALFAKMTIIDEELKREEVQPESEETQKENTLVFVPTPSGEIRVISDIEHIDQEYYEKFLGLFLSIKDGSFKNVKRFAPNSKWSRICEVKDFKVRVCFKRLTDDTYAVITAFTKKSNNEKYYQSSLTQKFDDFEKMEQGIRDSLTNEEFMAEQAKYEAELFRILMGNKKDKAPVLMKGAE